MIHSNTPYNLRGAVHVKAVSNKVTTIKIVPEDIWGRGGIAPPFSTLALDGGK
jgi:hypothetical protein